MSAATDAGAAAAKATMAAMMAKTFMVTVIIANVEFLEREAGNVLGMMEKAGDGDNAPRTTTGCSFIDTDRKLLFPY